MVLSFAFRRVHGRAYSLCFGSTGDWAWGMDSIAHCGSTVNKADRPRHVASRTALIRGGAKGPRSTGGSFFASGIDRA